MKLWRLAPISALVAALSSISIPASAIGGPIDPTPPFIPGSRVVQLRNESGGLGTFTSFESGSTFSSYGGAESSCPATMFGDDPATLDVVEADYQVASTRWVFVENAIPPEWLGGPNPLPVEAVSGPDLASRVRRFSVYCLNTSLVNFWAVIDVAPSDPFLDPHTQLASLYNGL
jgi:hypothetical protein